MPAWQSPRCQQARARDSTLPVTEGTVAEVKAMWERETAIRYDMVRMKREREE